MFINRQHLFTNTLLVTIKNFKLKLSSTGSRWAGLVKPFDMFIECDNSSNVCRTVKLCWIWVVLTRRDGEDDVRVCRLQTCLTDRGQENWVCRPAKRKIPHKRYGRTFFASIDADSTQKTYFKHFYFTFMACVNNYALQIVI